MKHFVELAAPNTGDYTGLKELILGPHFGWSHNAKATPYMENTRSYQDLSF